MECICAGRCLVGAERVDLTSEVWRSAVIAEAVFVRTHTSMPEERITATGAVTRNCNVAQLSSSFLSTR
jgi:hypothetical protein